MKNIKLRHSQPEVVNELVHVMLDASEDIECSPVDIVTACLQMTQRAIAHVVRHSDSHSARMLNQTTLLSAIDALKFSAIDSTDQRQVM